MKKSIIIKISGKVQGVFFRASTKEKADALGIKGTVRNEHDGSVLVEAEGEENIIDDFIAWCQHGPRMARVDHCEVTETNEKSFDDFVISR
jgi:acylphosphatase